MLDKYYIINYNYYITYIKGYKMNTKPCMTRLNIKITDVIEKTATEKKWSVSSTIADILNEVLINKRIPSYILEQ